MGISAACMQRMHMCAAQGGHLCPCLVHQPSINQHTPASYLHTPAHTPASYSVLSFPGIPIRSSLSDCCMGKHIALTSTGCSCYLFAQLYCVKALASCKDGPTVDLLLCNMNSTQGRRMLRQHRLGCATVHIVPLHACLPSPSCLTHPSFCLLVRRLPVALEADIGRSTPGLRIAQATLPSLHVLRGIATARRRLPPDLHAQCVRQDNPHFKRLAPNRTRAEATLLLGQGVKVAANRGPVAACCIHVRLGEARAQCRRPTGFTYTPTRAHSHRTLCNRRGQYSRRFPHTQPCKSWLCKGLTDCARSDSCSHAIVCRCILPTGANTEARASP